VQNPVKLKSLLDDEACFDRNFLDEAADAKRTNVWTIIKSGSRGDMAVLRNQEWPGYSGFNRINRNCHMEVYVGDGMKNSDFDFMN
jgi:hypothetical protein